MKGSDGKLTMRFIVPDLYIVLDESVEQHYRSMLFPREEVLRSLIRNADLKFDRFRHRFYIRYEGKGEGIALGWSDISGFRIMSSPFGYMKKSGYKF